MIRPEKFPSKTISQTAQLFRSTLLAVFFFVSANAFAIEKSALAGLQANLPHLNFTGRIIQLLDIASMSPANPELNIDQAVEAFSTGNFRRERLNELQNFGSQNVDHWFAVVIRNKTAATEPVFLYFEGINPDQIDLWMNHPGPGDSSLAYRQSGHDLPPQERDLSINTSAIRLDLPAGKDTILIWRYHHRGPSLVAMYLMTGTQISSWLLSDGMGLMTLIGGLLSLMLFSVFLFNAVRDRIYLLFIAQLAGFSVYLFTLHGYGNMYFWPTQQSFDKIINDLALIIAFLATVKLLQRFLHTKQNDPKLHLFMNGLTIMMMLLILLIVFDCTSGVLSILISIPLVILVAHVAAIRSIIRKEKGILISLIGWTIMSCSGCATATAYLGIQFSGPFMELMFRAEHWGIFGGSILFLFALIRRIQYLRLDKEQAEHKNRLKQDFIANISHEMRTPLNGIIGFAESVAHSDHLGEIKFYNRSILSESERLLFQINQLLDLAKIEAGRFDMEIKPFSLPQSLAYLQSAYSMKATAKGLDFNLSMDSACPLALMGDRLRLEQVLRNLIDNAIKFTDSGTIGVGVRVYRQDKIQAVLVFDISDTGIGIDQNKLDLIMEDFVQADSSITRRFGGTGLGTSISRRLVEAMDGHIEVKSTPGMGTNFRVYLPFGIATSIPEDGAKTLAITHRSTQQTNGEQRPTPPPPRENSTPCPRVLVVDDLDTNRQVLGIHLNKFNLIVDEAPNAEQALAMLGVNHYDLVLMDVFMPGMSGHDATRAIRAMPGLEKLPVIAVTASGFEEDLAAAQAAGMNEVLLKPVKRAALFELISRYVQM